MQLYPSCFPFKTHYSLVIDQNTMGIENIARTVQAGAM